MSLPSRLAPATEITALQVKCHVTTLTNFTLSTTIHGLTLSSHCLIDNSNSGTLATDIVQNLPIDSLAPNGAKTYGADFTLDISLKVSLKIIIPSSFSQTKRYSLNARRHLASLCGTSSDNRLMNPRYWILRIFPKPGTGSSKKIEVSKSW